MRPPRSRPRAAALEAASGDLEEKTPRLTPGRRLWALTSRHCSPRSGPDPPPVSRISRSSVTGRSTAIWYRDPRSGPTRSGSHSVATITSADDPVITSCETGFELVGLTVQLGGPYAAGLQHRALSVHTWPGSETQGAEPACRYCVGTNTCYGGLTGSPALALSSRPRTAAQGEPSFPPRASIELNGWSPC